MPTRSSFLLQLCCTHTQCVFILRYTCCKRAARELQESCNRTATELQQNCNRAATELQQSEAHTYSVCPYTTIYVLQQSCNRAESDQPATSILLRTCSNRAATELRAINQPQGLWLMQSKRRERREREEREERGNDQPATRAVAKSEYIRLCFIMLTLVPTPAVLRPPTPQ